MGIQKSQNLSSDAASYLAGVAGGSGVAAMAFAPDGGYVIVGRDGSFQAPGTPSDFQQVLRTLITGGAAIRSVAFRPGSPGGWVIVSDHGAPSAGLPSDCASTLTELVGRGSTVTCVVFPPAGGDGWVVVADDNLVARDISDWCYQTLVNFTQTAQRATGVAFAPGGGWAIYGGGGFFGIDIGACFQAIETLQTQNHLVECVAFAPSGGWAIASNDPMPSAGDPLRTFETQYHQDSPTGPWQSIYDRMGYYGVPGASVAFVEDNRVAWRTAYGTLEAGGHEYVYPTTPFQAGSISKLFAAIGITKLWEDPDELGAPLGAVTLWPIAVGPDAPPGAGDEVTVMQTLEHRAGFNVHGFAGYVNGPNVPLPSLDQILAGDDPPANSPAIEITTAPGAFHYSGGGYVVLMRMLEDVTGADFGQWMAENVLGPLAMSGSTFAVDLPPDLARAAVGHGTGTQPIPGLRNRYPESSAAGLYTNAGDLCRALVMLNGDGTIDSTAVLNKAQTQAILTDKLGLDQALGTLGHADFTYLKAGDNVGFVGHVQGYPYQRAGLAFLVNLADSAGNAAKFYIEGINALTRIYNL